MIRLQCVFQLRIEMLLLFVLLWSCRSSFSVPQGKTKNSSNGLIDKWYGPSYQPTGWSSSSLTGLIRSEDFSYDGANGPTTWPQMFSGCGGNQQSPINIPTNELKKRKTKKSLKWSNYSKVPRSMVLQNSLHSIHSNGIWKNSSYIPFITNGPLEKEYFFSQLHFHWGRNDATGSEHTVNKKSFPLEMHVVHDRRIEDPTNLSEESNSDSLVVVAYMFEIVKNDNPGLNPILEGIKDVQGSETRKTNIKPFALDELVEPFHGDYVSYKGSLTTPPCTEGVIWIISSKPLGISDRQLAIIRNSVRNRRGNRIANYRPVQRLNGRNIYYIHC